MAFADSIKVQSVIEAFVSRERCSHSRQRIILCHCATAISSETPAGNDEFGASAAVSDYYMIVGEPEDDHGGYSTAGSVVIYVIAPE